jgi:hypothetical protein
MVHTRKELTVETDRLRHLGPGYVLQKVVRGNLRCWAMVRRFAPRFAVERSNEGNARTGEGEVFVDGMGFNPVPRSPV